MHYHVARNGQQLGVFADYDIMQKIATGELSRNDLVWTDGMSEWQPIGSVMALGSAGITPGLKSGPPRIGVAELASLGQRLGAALLDTAAAIPGAILIGISVVNTDQSSGEMNSLGAVMMGIGSLYLLALIIYNLVRICTHGQSVGKMWTGIRIARIEDNSNPGFVKALLLRGFVNGLIGAIPVVGGLYSLVDICFIFREDRRCIHDHIAGTHVVKC